MNNVSFDPGLGQKLEGNLQRVIREDGSFAVIRKHSPLASFNAFVWLIGLSWPRFFAVIVSSFAFINAFFAALYLAVGTENLSGAQNNSLLNSYLSAYYFSVHTFTTVGYGNMAPVGVATNVISIIEILSGVLCVALITGLLYGRFSRPTAKLLFSKNIIEAPFDSGRALMFRVSNARPNILMELEAQLLVMLTRVIDGKISREYKQLALERTKITFLPLTWTVVHPLDDKSPIASMSSDELELLQAQFLILIKGFDETFSQVVHSRYSYAANDVVWNARFEVAYHTRPDGMVELDLNKVGSYELLAPGGRNVQEL